MTNMFKFKRQPSFNGLPFSVSKVSRSGHGRKFQTHEFPNGRGHLNEDLAPNVGKFSVTGYLIGFDAEARAQAIGAACDAPGVGILNLPDQTSISVRCANFGYETIKEEINKVTLTFDFVIEASNGSGAVVVMLGRLLEIGLGNVRGIMGGLGGGLNG